MRKPLYFLAALLLLAVASTALLNAQKPLEISIVAGKPVAEVSPTMWGVFFEDINFAADGGLYAEMVKNRSFEFSLPMIGWSEVDKNGEGRVMSSFYTPSNEKNPRFLRLVADAQNGFYGIENEGFRGMGVKKDLEYDFSMDARLYSGSGLSLKIELLNAKDEIIASSELSGFSDEWKKYRAKMISLQTEPKARLRLLFTGKGTVDLDMVSLFPSDTWKGRAGGLRNDLVQMIADLKPGFIRFPGGCIIEGRDLTNRYQWKSTVGPAEARKMIINRWNMEMKDHQTPDYFQSFGLGFFEYFRLAEDIGAEPLPVINCGMSCQFNSAEIVPLNEMDPYIRDALDLIEFANGDISTKWGSLRAGMGHPAPFMMKYIGVGNEQWEEQYIERYSMFENVLKKAHPEIKIVSGAGPWSSGKLFDYAWKELSKLSPDLIDEHYYMSPEWFFKNAGRYDNYSRKGIKVFAGEYAAHWKESSQAESRNTFYSALAEAAFMTGLERNGDVVNMASYAPLLAHVEAWQWRPDLIWFDNLKSAGTPNYYVQKLFSTHKGTHIIQALSEGKALEGQDSLYASATIDKNRGQIYLKIVNIAHWEKSVILDLQDIDPLKEGLIETLRSEKPSDFNSMEEPFKVYPLSKKLAITGKKINIAVGPGSANVIILNFRK